MTVSTADTAAMEAAVQLGRELERRDLLLWLDAVVQFQLHKQGDTDGAMLLRRVTDRIEGCEHIGGG